MTRCFRLCEFQDSLEIRNAHLSVRHDQVEDAEPGGVRAGEEDLRPQVDIKVF